MVVSFVPNFNGVMYRSLKKACPDVPYVTVMTDIADCPPHFWQEKQHQYIVCGSDKAVEQARAVGHTDDHIFQTTGMILKPSFYLSENIDKRVERIKLGLDPDLPTAIIMFGGNGSKVSLDIVKQLEQLPFKMQSIVLCGDNKRLYAKLRGHSRCIRVGYTANVPSFMRVADVFIGKPGPGSISEAVQCGLALIVERNMSTMPQERYNTVWIKNFELGIVVRDLQNVSKALRQMYTRNKINLFQSNAQKINNQAVFEIPIILRHIMLISGSQRPAISSHPIQVTELEADFTTLQSTFIK
jgi:1,2-diacylglycerol 3-beta-galactosyltransferase